MSAILATLLPLILPTLGTIVTGLLGWAASSIAKRNAAATAATKAQTALLKLGSIAVAMAGRAWDTLSPDIQTALADGKMSPEERTHIEEHIQALLKDFASADDLEQIASALGLPLPGLISKLAAMLIEKFAFAHDPEILSASPLAYPVNSGIALGGQPMEPTM